MDSSDYPSLPNLAKLHTRLYVDNLRVEKTVDSQLNGIDRLLAATIAEDWETVAEVSRYLAQLAPDGTNSAVVHNALQLCAEFGSEGASPTKRPKHLNTLLDACRAARKSWRTS